MINRLVIENLKHRWVRTALTICAVAIQVTMVLTLVGLSRGVLEDQSKRNSKIGADILVSAPGSNAISFTMNMRAGVLDLVRKQPHIAEATGVLIQGTGLFTKVTGIDIAGFTHFTHGGFHFIEGGPFQSADDVVIDSFYASEHHLKAGDHLQTLSHTWRVSGIVEPGMLARLFLPLDQLQELSANPGQLSIIYVKVDNPSRIPEVIAQLQARLKDYQIYSMEEFTSLFNTGNIPFLKGFISVIITLGVLVGFLVVFLSMYTAVLERTREIGILKSLGASPAYILNILARETVVLALSGSVIGIALSYGTRWLIQATTPGSLIQAIVPDWWPIAAAVALTGALLGAAYPGWKAARQDPIEALAYE